VLKRFDAALDRAARMARGELGRLRVGYLIGAAVDHVPSVLRAFTERYPDVAVELIEYDFGAPNCGLDTGTRTSPSCARRCTTCPAWWRRRC